MFEKAQEVFSHLVTGEDGVSHDLGRWSWLVTTVTLIGGFIWNGMEKHVMDLMPFAQAIGINTAAHGAAIFMKKDTEPKAPEATKPPLPSAAPALPTLPTSAPPPNPYK